MIRRFFHSVRIRFKCILEIIKTEINIIILWFFGNLLPFLQIYVELRLYSDLSNSTNSFILILEFSEILTSTMILAATWWISKLKLIKFASDSEIPMCCTLFHAEPGTYTSSRSRHTSGGRAYHLPPRKLPLGWRSEGSGPWRLPSLRCEPCSRYILKTKENRIIIMILVLFCWPLERLANR